MAIFLLMFIIMLLAGSAPINRIGKALRSYLSNGYGR